MEISCWYGRLVEYYNHSRFNVKRTKDKSRISYVIFSDVCSEIEFTEACFGKLVISLSRIDILRINVEDMKNTCW